MLENAFSWPLRNKNSAGISLYRVCILEKNPESLKNVANYKIYFPLFSSICDIQLRDRQIMLKQLHVYTLESGVHTQNAVKKHSLSASACSVYKESSSLRWYLVSVTHVTIEIAQLNSVRPITRAINMICYVFGGDQLKKLMQIII